ncbi:hypothetical protein SAMN04488056_101479 [Cohaesibacter marisflavi]|uniref:Uncharacterized protein n=1 Tax=Cohaesibacter marisflavi TaxID=655353 RepID=A0A1I5AG54_9HYPH|nr:hypothetical protein [Cohaesibacter marisflavi]SFN61451.1 hypothetical protein SAMN04488056_101479 [Cohaesibacter marisflavi]
MKINLVPQRRDDTLVLQCAGEELTLNGQALDLSIIPAGGNLPLDTVGCEWLASDITRNGEGDLALSLILPHGYIADPTTQAAKAVLYPSAINVTEEGPISLPSYEATAS